MLSMQKLRKNVSFTLGSNLFVLFVSALTSLILPKFIDVENYGYYQLYILVFSYSLFPQLGWSDGVYLRYGGQSYESLDKQLGAGQFYALIFSQFFFSIVLLFFTPVLGSEQEQFVIYSITFSLVFVNAKQYILLTLQATSNFQKSAQLTIIDRLIFLIGFIILIFLRVKRFQWFTIVHVAATFISFIVAVIMLKEITLENIKKPKFSWTETKENLRAGFVLTISTTASMLIIGAFRFSIVRAWDISVFAKVSLTLNISNFVLIFIRSVSVVLFPMFRNMNKDRLKQIYSVFKVVLVSGLFVFIASYYPLKAILNSWLPEYSDSIYYMSLIFPIILFECLQNLLINTMLKSLRKEQLLMKVNIFSLVLTVVLIILNTVIFPNINNTLLSMLGVMIFRCFYSESFLVKEFDMNKNKVIHFAISMIMLSIVFILSASLLSDLLSFTIYVIAVTMVLFSHKQEIITSYTEAVRKFK